MSLEAAVNRNQEDIGVLKTNVAVIEAKTLGNGNIGHAQRITSLEEKEENGTCETGKAFRKYLDGKERRRSFRAGDIANYISLAGLIFIIVKELL